MNVVQRFSSSHAIVLGAGLLLLGLGAFATESRCPLQSGELERWVLHAHADPDCVYGSAWNDGDLLMPRSARAQRTIRFVHQYVHIDGCIWQGIETLTAEAGGYFYEYREHPLSCIEDAEPARACPLTGHVTFAPAEDGE
jgi:hypothetical protein